MRGNQNGYKLDQVKIFELTEFQTVNFACYMDMNMKPVSMITEFDKVKKTLTLSVEQPEGLKFNAFHSIHFGDSSKDINLCDPNSFAYKLPADTVLDLSKSELNVILEHVAGTLPNIALYLGVKENGNVINAKWTFAVD